jgi:UDP-glucose 4-epimerase
MSEIKKIVVIGGAGFVGSHTVDRLVIEGWEVTVFDIKSWNKAIYLHPLESKINYVEGDIRNIDQVSRVFQGQDLVLHLAAVVSVPGSVDDPVGTHITNVDGTLNVFESARKSNIKKVVYASSAAVYGSKALVPTKESSSLLPDSPYGLHKMINDQYADIYNRLFGLSTIGLRYFNIFGVRQDPLSSYSGVVSVFWKKINTGESVTIYGDGLQTRDFVHVDNIVEANLLALNSDRAGVYNVGTGLETSLLDLVAMIEKVVGKKAQIDYKDKRIGDIEKSVADITKIKNELGYIPNVDLESGLKKLI